MEVCARAGTGNSCGVKDGCGNQFPLEVKVASVFRTDRHRSGDQAISLINGNNRGFGVGWFDAHRDLRPDLNLRNIIFC
jgi:hypothetical protein